MYGEWCIIGTSGKIQLGIWKACIHDEWCNWEMSKVMVFVSIRISSDNKTQIEKKNKNKKKKRKKKNKNNKNNNKNKTAKTPGFNGWPKLVTKKLLPINF